MDFSSYKTAENKVPVEVSAKHIHISKKDADILFGPDHVFSARRQLKFNDVFVTSDSVEIRVKGGSLPNVHIVMPFRDQTKVELAATDIFKLTKETIFDSEGKQRQFDVEIVGPKGRLKLDSMPLVACRHLHASPSDAESLGLKDGDVISVVTDGPRSVVLNNVLVRVQEGAVLTCHLDTDEGHAAGISREGFGFVIKD